jgi:hypothetical protein
MGGGAAGQAWIQPLVRAMVPKRKMISSDELAAFPRCDLEAER